MPVESEKINVIQRERHNFSLQICMYCFPLQIKKNLKSKYTYLSFFRRKDFKSEKCIKIKWLKKKNKKNIGQ